ncbi:MAG: AAA family ATPase [Planctomycetaceae bacterium]|nr:AAA family ATPase [Planctomycetaceae bacterium]
MNWDELTKSLQQPGFWPEPGDVEVIETHISGIFLVGERAYKVKKPVDLGFVNFTTLKRRKHFCEEELRLNRRLAPDLYLDMCRLTDSENGPEFEGEGSVIEYAVEMERFDQDSLMIHAEQEGELTFEHMDQLAELIADFHANCPTAPEDEPFGEAESVCLPVEENFRHLLHENLPDDLHERLSKLQGWSRDEHERLHDTFAERKAEGCVRECHGDMHLGNMILEDDRITIFDCIEFNDSFRWIDVLSEVAFCAMDLADRGHPELAHHFLNRYLEITGDYAGLPVLPYYLCYRAMVRAKVTWLRLQQHPGSEEEETLWTELKEYIALAEQYAFHRHPQLIVMHGVSGTGKSFGSKQLVHALGAIRIRSDVERKRLAAQIIDDDDEAEEVDLYDPAMTASTYGCLHFLAGIGLEAGFPILLDATYLKSSFRTDALQVGDSHQVPVRILHLTAKNETLRQRILARQDEGADPSDADLTILQMQLKNRDPLTNAERDRSIEVDTEQPDCWQRVIETLQP